MNKFAHLRLFCAGLFLALAFSSALPISAFADDGTPPPTDPAPPADDGSATNPDASAPIESNEVAPTTEGDETAPAADEPAVATEVVLDGATAAETGTVETTVATDSLLTELPADTEVVVLDEQGMPVSLASEEAAGIIAGSDPIWCPASVAVPKPSMNGCTASYGKLSDLLAFLITDQVANPMLYNKDGTIWIEKTYDSSIDDGAATNYTLDGGSADFALMKDFKLNIKGGWEGCGLIPPASCVGTINLSDPSEINVPLHILAWNNDVTLSDLLITGVTSSPALQVTTTKNIVLTRVVSEINTAKGADLDNTSGTGNTTVTNSEFNQNSVTGGLSTSSNGTITLANVIADNNTGGYGVTLVNSGAPTAKNVSLTGTNQFNSNQTHGLIINSKGLISAANLTASYNGVGAVDGNGVTLDNTTSTTAQGVTLTGINIFLNNLDTGLLILSEGIISASNVYASSNLNSHGAWLNNSGAATALGVNLTGSSEFKNNIAADGLRVQSKGAVTLSNVTASLNGINGVEITNTYLVGGTAAVTLTGTNVFLGNASRGIDIDSLGAISLNAVTANNNGIGADLNNSTASAPQKVALSGINAFNDNSTYGLFVNSKGTITANSVTANNNSSNSGAFLYNNYGLDTSMQGIKLSGTNVLNGNGAYGLVTGSYGPISVANITANNNLGGDGINLNNGGAATPQSVTVSGVNTASGNFYTGLNVYTKGAIKVNSVTANLNGIVSLNGVGAYLDNSPVGALGAVALTGTNVFNGNYYSGLFVVSKGAISLANITANASVNSKGAGISNLGSGAATPQNVSLSGTNTFNGNYYSGLEVFTHGTITANNLTANLNGIVAFDGYGVYLNNNTALTPKAVTLTGTNVFDGNYDEGLYVNSKGAIAASNVTASNSVTKNGAFLHNNTAAGPQNVTLTGNNRFEDNNDDGLQIVSIGAISINSVTSTGNGISGFGNGAYLRNQASAAPQNVIITGTNIFNTNATYGLDVYSKGTISLNNTTASGNINGYGAILDNTAALPASIKGVKLTGTNAFSSNGDAGLFVNSYGPISLNSVTANNNGNQGSVLYNYLATSPQKVAITGTNSFSTNATNGLAIASLGAVTLNNVNASNNVADYGAGVQNDTSALPQPVTLSGTNVFSGNNTFGLQILSKGVITVNSVTASGNTAGKGADLQNTFGTSSAAQGVKLTGTNVFNGNVGNGLYVSSFGAITANNVTANSSVTSDGAYLYNGGSAGPQGVTLTGTNAFGLNDGNGLYIETIGAISLNNINATGNGTDTTGNGVFLWNNTAFAPQKVSITGTNVFNSNQDSGLWVVSKGIITMNNVSANGNTDYGAHIENSLGATGFAQGVTLTGSNAFSGNTSLAGLYITSYGPVSINNVTANTNGDYGANISNDGADNPQKVALTGISTFNANSSGLNVNTKGAVTSATSLTANDNGITGANFNNTGGVATSGVSLLGTNTFNSNVASDGLLVQTAGAIILNNVTASGNGNSGGDHGAQLAGPTSVTLTGVNVFSDNYDVGLNVISSGAISVNSVTANDNDGMAGVHGIVLVNTFTDNKAVTLTGNNTFNGNTGTGLFIQSKGAITLNNITAKDNGTSGADIQNQTAVAAPQFVKLNGTNLFSGNTDTGLQVLSYGAITVNNLTASENLNGGALLDNDEAGATALSTVTLTGTHFFNDNTNLGLRIRSTSTVNLSKLTADDNSAQGLEITTTGAVTLSCASITSNGGNGLDVTTLGVVTLKGVISSGNTGGDIVSSVVPVIIRTCP